MKAYKLGVKSDPDQGNEIVFANTSKEARQERQYLEPESFIDLEVLRAPEFDGMENATHFEMMLKQWHEGWWFDTFNHPGYPEDTTDEEFKIWYEKEYKD